MSLDWSNERYIRLYRPSVDHRALCWQARAIWPLLMQEADGAGVIGARKGVAGVAKAIDFPIEVVEAGVADLLEDGCLVAMPGGYVIRNYVEMQGLPVSATERQRRHRQLRKNTNSGSPVTYAIRQGGPGGAVKIGVTTDLDRRVWQLQNGSPAELHLLHSVAGDIEVRLHAACSAYRVRGEWFDGTAAMLLALEAAIGVES